jgi:hypothetical protein
MSIQPLRARWLVILASIILIPLAIAWIRSPAPYHLIENATALTVFEGLPHPMYETALFEEQRKLPNTTMLSGFPFYTDPLVLTKEDPALLKHLLGTGTDLHAYTGMKKCGGFHPDYAVQWSVSGDTYLALICFGCGEVRIDAPDQTPSMYDIRSNGQPGQKSELFTLLNKYRANRPPHDHFGPLGFRQPTSLKVLIHLKPHQLASGSLTTRPAARSDA